MNNKADRLIFSEDFDYSETGDSSIWGEGDSETLKLLKTLVNNNKITGKWLNFAAGDGRYNNILLSQSDQVIATDIDKGALEKLKKTTPKNLLKKIKLIEQNIVEKFPFKNNIFDGVFNTGTLHLFPTTSLELIFSEVSRMLKASGIFIFDFATDIKRVKEDGGLIGMSKNEYTKNQAKAILTKILTQNGFTFQFYECIVPPEKVTSADGTYTFSCNYWLVIAKKINSQTIN